MAADPKFYLEMASSGSRSSLTFLDKKTREEGFQQFVEWICRSPPTILSEMVRSWKALYVCFWLTDKIDVQQDLAARIADLLTKNQDREFGLLFVRAFFITLVREWPTLDSHRTDKVYFLTKALLSRSFRLLQSGGWVDCRGFSTILSELIFQPREFASPHAVCPDSIRYFIAEYFLPQLEAALPAEGRQLSTQVGEELLRPFLFYLVPSAEAKVSVVKKMEEFIFAPIAAGKSPVPAESAKRICASLLEDAFSRPVPKGDEPAVKRLKEIAKSFGYRYQKSEVFGWRVEALDRSLRCELQSIFDGRSLPWSETTINPTQKRNRKVRWGNAQTKNFTIDSPVSELHGSPVIESKIRFQPKSQ